MKLASMVQVQLQYSHRVRENTGKGQRVGAAKRAHASIADDPRL